MRFRLTLLTSLIASTLAPVSSSAAELDYLELNSAEANVMIITDSSSSVAGFYDDFWSETDPAIQPNHPDNVKLRSFISDLKSTLKHMDIVEPKTAIKEVTLCMADAVYGEGDSTGCNDERQVWYISKQDLLMDILRDVVVDLRGGNVAFMRTSSNLDGVDEYIAAGRPENNIRNYDTAGLTSNGALVVSAFKEVNSTRVIQEIAAALDDNRQVLYEAKTPLAESLYEALMYYTGQTSPWPKSVDRGWKDWEIALEDSDAYGSGDRYDSVMTRCSSNNIVMFTDGAPTWDWHSNSLIDRLVAGKNVGPRGPITRSKPWNWTCGDDAASDTTPAQTRLDDLAGYMANYDLRDDLPGKQTITTHFASTWESCASPEILDTAAAGTGGFHVPATDMNKLRNALTEIIDDIKENSFASFMTFNTTKSNPSGNPLARDKYAYVNISEQHGGLWMGNLKKFLINDKGKLIDKNGNTISQNDTLNEDAVDFWSNTGSGVETLNGGASSKMSPIYTNRYTLTTGARDQSIINTGNLFSPNNNQIPTPGVAGEERRELLKWAGGMNTMDIDGDGDSEETRPSLGDMINTKPVLAYYGNDESVVFTGTNEGFLHAFDAENGEHLYSFMPPELLSELTGLRDQGVDKTFGIDGVLKVYQSDKHNTYQLEDDEQLYLFMGLRRGGEALYVLNITDRNNPKVAWRISTVHQQFADIGQSWTSPEIVKIPWTNNTEKEVVIIGGGLDERYQNNENPTNTKGSQLYVIDLETGDVITTVNSRDIPSLSQSVINKSISIDADMNGTIDATFFNDVRGNIYRCDIKQRNKNAKPTFTCGVQAQAQGNNENLFFFNAMDAALTNSPATGQLMVSLTITSGNRFMPTERQEQNRLVTFFVPLSQLMSTAESNIDTIRFRDIKSTKDVTATADEQGWYFEFPARGEKSFSQTLIIDDIIHFSTYEPIIDENATNNCQTAGVGTAKLYSLQLKSGQKLKSAASELRWTGIAKGLPETPYAVINAKSLDSNYTVNLGIDNTDVDAKISPLSRDYWFEPE